ncbi:hypothetical protein [Mycolicibacterium aichiense]|uniref:Mycothiol synthase n=1 Tax=Mycolicibacterium aichiense TaxID=1799 RepID=A0AAD1MD71_9MYCO|nr:hypothetical protein [Mycolicibacterium aichiense]MCV7019358.1 hypothetical protein [Mycolicibacterium aichiense]BBX09273.1 hypothetical protein MAIC_40760 [Mycolicibacterium aichiense]SUA13841.1 mycothiol synthase [Mycolicibacterium aichiense]
MIKYEWRDTLSDDESTQLADLLRRAADYDAEPEYTTIEFADIAGAMASSDPRYRHLLVWMLPYATALGAADHPERIAGVIRLTVNDDGTAEASGVVDPQLRSIGIMTLLFERIGLDTSGPQGWQGTGAHIVTAWAKGNHPASGRISNRFLIARTRRVWKLVRPTASVNEAAGAPVLEPISTTALAEYPWASTLIETAGPHHALRESGRVIGAVGMDFTAVESEEFGRCATVRALAATPQADANSRRRLLNGAAALAHEAGLTGLVIHVDSDDAAWVNVCRLVNFQHDRTDVLLQLGGHR